MTLTYADIQKSLQEKFYVNVPFLLKRASIEEAIQAFFKFLEEPDEIKTHINFKITEKHRRGDIGYVQRNPEDHIYNDSKEFFHFHPALFEKYEDFLKTNPIVNTFCQKAKPIWELAYQTVHQILNTFEPKFPGVCSRIFDNPHPHIMLRFLKYDWQDSGKYLAKPHFDSGSFTLAIAESGAGLRIGSKPEDLQLVEHKSDNAVFMIASNYRKIMDTDEFHPGWHDVIQLDETMIGKPFARWAVVVFIDGDVEALPRSETHKWYKPE